MVISESIEWFHHPFLRTLIPNLEKTALCMGWFLSFLIGQSFDVQGKDGYGPSGRMSSGIYLHLGRICFSEDTPAGVGRYLFVHYHWGRLLHWLLLDLAFRYCKKDSYSVWWRQVMQVKVMFTAALMVHNFVSDLITGPSAIFCLDNFHLGLVMGGLGSQVWPWCFQELHGVQRLEDPAKIGMKQKPRPCFWLQIT